MEQIRIEIENGGETKISVKGVKGGGCKALTADIEKALGEVKSTVATGEACQTAVQASKAVQR